MKETDSVLEVLVYLFEHYFYDDSESSQNHDRDSLQASLVQAGFSPTEISKAFDWLEEPILRLKKHFRYARMQ